MHKDYTSINIILDSSGSMMSLVGSTLSGFNTFLAEQKVLPGKVDLTLVTFSDKHNMVHNCVSLNDIANLNVETYCPSGGTALLDAIGFTVNNVGAKLASMPESDRPSKVLFLIITDGAENSSHEFTKNQIKDMITHQQDKYSWSFVYMGANLDAISEGTSLGIAAANTYNYSADQSGTKSLYSNVSKGVSRHRGGENFTIDPNALIMPVK